MAIATDVVPRRAREAGLGSGEERERLRWLGLLRWWAMGGAMGGTVVSLALGWTFVSPPGLAAGVVAGVCVNAFLLWRTRRVPDVGTNELALHATADLLLLTWLLAFSGGLTNPLSVFYSFHVVLGALLSGRRGALAATAVSSLCITALFVLERVGWLPTTPLDRAPELLWLTGLALLLLGLTYFALVLAQRLRAERERAVEKQEEAVSHLRLLLGSLDALKVGLEVFDERGETVVRNRYAETVRALPVVKDARPPEPRDGVFRFALTDHDDKRIIDRVALGHEGALGAYLYVDRTDELLVEQRHVMLERLATLGRALQGVAHELNTPLMTMQTLAKDLEAALKELPLDDVQRKDLEESVQLIVEESRRCKGLTQSLLQTAQPRAWSEESAGLTLLAIARRAVQLVGSSVDKGEVELDEGGLDLPCPRDPDRVLQVLMNLVQNALRASEDVAGGTFARGPRAGEAPVRVSARREGAGIVIVIEDRGPGLPDEVRARLFEPFVTTRAAGGGTGLGLYVSQMIARELGGELSLDDRPGGGTSASLSLPALSPSTGGERADIALPMEEVS